jgi:hypothetical protein
MATTEPSSASPAPGSTSSPVDLEAGCENFVGGAWAPPTAGVHREHFARRTRAPFCAVAPSAPRGRADAHLVSRSRPRGRLGGKSSPAAGR